MSQIWAPDSQNGENRGPRNSAPKKFAAELFWQNEKFYVYKIDTHAKF